MGFEHEKPGPHVAVLTQLGAEVWAVDEGKVPTRAGIDSDPDSDFDFDNDRTDRTDRTDRVLVPGG